jgi:hypothetical protein
MRRLGSAGEVDPDLIDDRRRRGTGVQEATGPLASRVIGPVTAEWIRPVGFLIRATITVPGRGGRRAGRLRPRAGAGGPDPTANRPVRSGPLGQPLRSIAVDDILP